MKHFSKSLNLLLILVVLDLAFIVLSLIDTLSNLNFGNFLVQLDGGFAEKYQYLKFIGVSLMSIILWIKRRSIQYLIFTIIPLYLYWDDSKQIHERAGTKFASLIYKGNANDTLISNFRFQDIGEILYMSLIAFAFLIIFLICFRLSNNFERLFMKKIFYLLIIFGIFAMAIDSIHQLFSGKIYDLVSIIEDGGEMIPISVVSTYFLKNLFFKKELNF